MKRFTALLLVFVLAVSFTSCFESDLPLEEVVPNENVRIDPVMPEEDYEVTPLISPDGIIEGDPIPEEDKTEPFGEVGAETPEEAVAGIGADLVRQLYKDGENMLISPVSVSLALGLTAGGAGGETFNQLEKALGKGVSFHDMRDWYLSISERLEDSGKVEIDLANSLWVKDGSGVDLKKSYLQFADKYFDADVFKENFDEKTLKRMNDWVKDETDGMIPKLLDEISPYAVMYIVNTLSFEAEWQTEYKSSNIYPNFTFTDGFGNQKTVTALGSKEAVYLEDENSVGFVKNYKGGEYGFAVLLPNEDVKISDYVRDLTGEKITKILSDKREADVVVKFPKFKIEYNTFLNDSLKAMGIKDAFDPYKADFSGLSDGDLYVTNVIHKTYIEVAEKGTRAAAVTAVEMPKGMAPTQAKETKYVTADRPFVFAIIDNTSNLPIFIGVVQNIG